MEKKCANEWPRECLSLGLPGEPRRWIQLTFEGKTYNFCSGRCLRAWVPHAYLPGDDLHVVDLQVVLGADMEFNALLAK